MCFKPIRIFAFWDDAVHCWVARSDDMPRISATAESRQALSAKLKVILDELQKEYGGQPGAELPVEVVWQPPPASPSESDRASARSARVRQLEREVAALTPEELAAFREWFVAHDNELWDRQIVADAAAGKLDALAEAALGEHRAGKTTRL